MQDPSLYSQIKAQVQQPPVQFPEQEHLKCPRCDSTNTKFCYYNNYNLSQPRHFCKNCRRYWTKGGALRNIPVGGGSRKNAKRSSSATSASSAAVKRPAPPSIKNDHGGEKVENKNFLGQFGNLLETSGSFSSLLGSSVGQFGNFLEGLGPNGQISDQFPDPGSGQNVDPHGLESDVLIHGGAAAGGGGGWSGGSNGWPDLSIYTPGSTFL